jgi:hypothetical protein
VGKSIGDKGQVTCTGCHNPHGPLNSGRCIDCHPQSAETLSKESEKARRFHTVAAERGTECIRCHKALAHPIKNEQERLEQPGPKQQDETLEESALPQANAPNYTMGALD